MASLVVTNTFVAGTTILSAAMNTNFDDIETYINNRNSGAAVWERVLATNSSDVPAVFNNSTGTQNILNAQDNGQNVFQVTNAGNIVPGAAALPLNATDGFVYLEGCAGTPSGVPTAFTGRVATVFDTTNNILYIYDGGWLNASNPAVDNSTIELNGAILRVKASGITGNELSATYVQTARPAFLVTNSASQSNVTGDSTTYAVVWDTEIFDQASNFASNTFTAPLTGRYLLNIDLSISGITTSHTGLTLRLKTSNRNYEWQEVWASLSQITTKHYSLSHVCDMDISDTASIELQVTGGTKVITVRNGTNITKFSGALLF